MVCSCIASKLQLLLAVCVVCIVCSLIASKLKSGMSVPAEQFEDASLFYSDIKGFTKLASESNAGEIVVLLNELYLMFDTAIDRYNAYKVSDIYQRCYIQHSFI